MITFLGTKIPRVDLPLEKINGEADPPPVALGKTEVTNYSSDFVATELFCFKVLTYAC